MQSDAAQRPPEFIESSLNPADLPNREEFDHLRETIIFPGLVFKNEDIRRPVIPEVTLKKVASGEAAWLSLRSPSKETDNEDSVAAFPISAEAGLLAVADGLGGHRGGRRASQMVIKSLQKGVKRVQKTHAPKIYTISNAVHIPTINHAKDSLSVQSIVLEHIDHVNSNLMKSGSGAATTMALVEVKGNKARSYHAGDSEILIVSQRGRLKHETVSHSPVSYALQAGLLTEHEAMQHEERHLVSNVVGSRDLSIDLGPWVKLSPRDTVLIASDGLFDNLTQAEIIDTIRIGKLDESVHKLAELALQRMTMPEPGLPSKCDDLTILAYRATRPKRKKAAAN